MKNLLFVVLVAFSLPRLFGEESAKQYETAEIYRSMRQLIFDLQKEKPDIKDSDRLAIIMETGLEDACYTLVATWDGSASLYFSNGGGIIGVGGRPQGAAAAKEFLNFSKNFDGQLKEVSTFPLPQPGMTRFYVIKKDSVLTTECLEEDLGNGKLPLSPLFHKGHNLITIIRLIDEEARSQEASPRKPNKP